MDLAYRHNLSLVQVAPNIQDKHVFHRCFHVHEGKTKAAARAIPVHPLIKPLLEPMSGTFGKGYLIDGIKSGGYDNKRS